MISPSFWRVRSCVSSSERPSESTLSFTSPTLVRTNFFVAHAVEPPTAMTAIGMATKNFRNMINPPNAKSGEIAPRCNRSGLERSGPCRAHGPRADASPVCRSIRTRSDTDDEVRRRSAAPSRLRCRDGARPRTRGRRSIRRGRSARPPAANRSADGRRALSAAGLSIDGTIPTM